MDKIIDILVWIVLTLSQVGAPVGAGPDPGAPGGPPPHAGNPGFLPDFIGDDGDRGGPPAEIPRRGPGGPVDGDGPERGGDDVPDGDGSCAEGACAVGRPDLRPVGDDSTDQEGPPAWAGTDDRP